MLQPQVVFLEREALAAVADVGDCYHTLAGEVLEFSLHGIQAAFFIHAFAELVDLVDKAAHACSLAESAFKVGKLYVAVGVHKTRDKRSPEVINRLVLKPVFALILADIQNLSVIVKS